MFSLLGTLRLLIFAASISQEPAWRVFMPADSSFAISLPIEPTLSIRYTPTPNGLLPTRTLSSAAANQLQFLVSWTTYPNDVPRRRPVRALLDRARDALLESQGDGSILAATDDPIGAYPGRSTTYRTTGGRLLQVRFLWIRDRFYQVMAETPDTPAARAAAARFFASFRIELRAAI